MKIIMIDKKKAIRSIVLTVIAIGSIWLGFKFGGALIGLLISFAVLIIISIFQMANILSLMGQRQYANGNNNRALALLKKSSEMWCSKVGNITTYAYVLLRVGKPDEAKSVLNYKLLDRSISAEDKISIKQILSLIHYRQNNFEDAVELMSEVFEARKSSSIYGALAYYKILAGDEDAMDFCLEAYDYNSDDKIIVDNLIIMHLKNGDYEKAKELSDASIEKGNKGVEIFYHAAQSYFGLGDKEKAKELLLLAQSCTRSFMTTVSEAEIEDLLEKC